MKKLPPQSILRARQIREDNDPPTYELAGMDDGTRVRSFNKRRNTAKGKRKPAKQFWTKHRTSHTDANVYF